MLIQERYWGEYNRDGIREKMAESFDSLYDWIKETITEPKELKLAFKRFKECFQLNKTDPDAYPLHHIARHFFNGAYKRTILPVGNNGKSN
jgi:hypothetical protein